MKKLIGFVFVLFVGLCMASVASAYRIAWDEVVADPVVTGYTLYSTTTPTDEASWSELANYGNVTLGDLPDNPNDDERVYYRLTATNADGESGPSNVISFYWETGSAGGGPVNGWVGPQAPTLFRIVDCTKNPSDPVCGN